MSSALQTLNEKNKAAEWAGRIIACRNSGMGVKEWCSMHNICTQSYRACASRRLYLAGGLD